MPRPRKEGAPEPKTRSRTGCNPCKDRKVKCDERRPTCEKCERQGTICDYNVRLKWGGREKIKGQDASGLPQVSFSTGSIGVAADGRLDAVDTTSTPSTPHTPRFSLDSSRSPSSLNESRVQDVPPAYNNGTANLSGSLYLDPTESLQEGAINSALAGTKHLPGNAFSEASYGSLHSRPDLQYTQSYERYHSSPTSAPSEQAWGDQNSSDNRPTWSSSSLSPSMSSTGLLSNQSYEQGITQAIGTPTTATTSPALSTITDGIQAQDNTNDYRPPKRTRYQSSHDNSLLYDQSMPPPSHSGVFGSYLADLRNSPSSGLLSLNSVSPLTPASSTEDDGLAPRSSSKPDQESPDLRRLSVHSLLSGPPGMPYQSLPTSAPRSNPEIHSPSAHLQELCQDSTTYGIDRGFKDLDFGINDDVNAISGLSPVTMKSHLELVLDDTAEAVSPLEFGFGNIVDSSSGEYYDKPVPICIPKALEPLPNILRENNMNLLYFHHFINHTANYLVPHNCSSNPFKNILPRMAVEDNNLLKLLLAYSASHRARLLRHPEPATRIAQWVEGVFEDLRQALDDPSRSLTNSNLASAIMLASLEIISPKAFGVAVPWQQHLDVARQMVAARGGPQSGKLNSSGDMPSSFLYSWFAYLDVLGSLSGGKGGSPSSSWIMYHDDEDENDYNIDCILGFTSRCIRILAKIAELSRICDGERIGLDAEVRLDWRPSDQIVEQAKSLEAALAESREHPAKPCTHMQSSGEVAYQWDNLEMAATNEAYHWAGLVHLHRRILGEPSSHSTVQQSVRQIFKALFKVRRGSSAEACLLFPMFTAGCDTDNEKQRSEILDRIKGVERSGMTQVHNARTLMERVWQTGKPWETLVAGEFVG